MTAAVAIPSAELHEFSALLDFVYQGATAPSKWPEILPVMADWVRTEKLILVTPTRGVDVGGFLFTHQVSESTNELWRAKWQSDLWANAAIEQGKMFEGSIVLGQEVVPTAKLVESDWYKQFLSHAGIMFGMWGVVFGVESPAMPLVVPSSVMRTSGSAPSSTLARCASSARSCARSEAIKGSCAMPSAIKGSAVSPSAHQFVTCSSSTG